MKFVTPSTQFITNQSLASSFTSPTVTVLQDDILGITLTYTGSPVGTATILGSHDGINFATLSFSVNGSNVSSFALPGSASPIVLDFASGSIGYAQVVYTVVSGSGTMNGLFTKKRYGS